MAPSQTGYHAYVSQMPGNVPACVELPSFGDLIKSIGCETKYHCPLCHCPLVHAQTRPIPAGYPAPIMNTPTACPDVGEPSVPTEDCADPSHHSQAGPREINSNSPLRATAPQVDTSTRPRGVPNPVPSAQGKKRSPKLMAVEFTDVAAHTAKCDICDKRNRNGMSRCVTCGWQCCRMCQTDKKGDRSHSSFNYRHEEMPTRIAPEGSRQDTTSQAPPNDSIVTAEDYERRNPPRRARPSSLMG